jgi:hypothetical protein
MRPIFAFHAVLAVGGALAFGSVTGCYDEEPMPPARPSGSTVVVSSPGVASPQPTVVQQLPAPQPAPPPVINVVQPPAAPAPAPATTVNVQPRTVP